MREGQREGKTETEGGETGRETQAVRERER